MTFSNFLNTNSKNTENIRTVDGDFQMDSTANEECLKSQKTEIDTIKEKNSFKMAISSLSRKGKIIVHKDKERVANQDTFKTKENENNLFIIKNLSSCPVLKKRGILNICAFEF